MEFTNQEDKRETLTVTTARHLVWLDIHINGDDIVTEFALTPEKASVLADELKRAARMV